MTTGAPRSLDDLLAADYAWTPRQRQVLDLMARGKTNTEIGEARALYLCRRPHKDVIECSYCSPNTCSL
jgi:DNA-binding NarL/FixJ family response regulator